MTNDATRSQSSARPEPCLLRASDVARRCSVSLRTVRAWIASGRLEIVRLSPRTVRVTEQALTEFLSSLTERAP